MALIKCPECGTEISDKARKCPKCGCPKSKVNKINKESNNQAIKSNNKESNDQAIKLNNKKVITIISIVAVLLILAAIVITGLDNNDDSYYDQPQDENVPQVNYISNRTAQYNEEDKQYVVFFGLQASEYGEYMSSSGVADIVIKDDTGNELYNKKINFTDSDFTTWTNSYWDNSRYLCGLYINASDIKGSASSTGTLTLSVSGENFEFSPYNIQLFNLPIKQIKVDLPDLPKKIYNYTYTGNTEKVINITDIKYETTSNYDSTSTIKFTFTVKMITNYSNSTSTYSQIGYKLKNSKGVIVNSGTHFVDAMSVGETVLEELSIYDLNPNDTYTLTLENVK